MFALPFCWFKGSLLLSLILVPEDFLSIYLYIPFSVPLRLLVYSVKQRKDILTFNRVALCFKLVLPYCGNVLLVGKSTGLGISCESGKKKKKTETRVWFLFVYW